MVFPSVVDCPYNGKIPQKVLPRLRTGAASSMPQDNRWQFQRGYSTAVNCEVSRGKDRARTNVCVSMVHVRLDNRHMSCPCAGDWHLSTRGVHLRRQTTLDENIPVGLHCGGCGRREEKRENKVKHLSKGIGHNLRKYSPFNCYSHEAKSETVGERD